MPAENYSHQIFLSHCSEDKHAARQLALELSHAGLRVWFDEWEIGLGDNIYLKIEAGIEGSQSLILLMSRAFFESEWTAIERSAAVFRDPSNLTRPLIPILLSECDIPTVLHRIKHYQLEDFAPKHIEPLIRTIAFRLGHTIPQRLTPPQQTSNALPVQLPNSAGDLAEVYTLILEQSSHAKKSAVLFFDIDGFSFINAKHSVTVGEKVIGAVGSLISGALPDESISVRWRADEFVVLIRDVNERTALHYAKDILELISKYEWHHLSPNLFVSASCGVAARTRRSKEADVEWFERAILGCREGKGRGGGIARVGQRINSTQEEKIRKSIKPLAHLGQYSSDD